jgi:hypothetical protein
MQSTAELNLTVRIENFSADSLGQFMGDMRTWLDHQGIQPIDFRPGATALGNFAYDVQFGDLQHAALFRAAFVDPLNVASIFTGLDPDTSASPRI